MWYEDAVLELARVQRQAMIKAVERVRAGQLGEAWISLPDGRQPSPGGSVASEGNPEGLGTG